MKSDDATEVLHAPLVIVIDHNPDLAAHVDHALDQERDNIEGVGVGPSRVKDEEEVELVLGKEGGGVVVHVEEVVVEVDLGLFPSFYNNNKFIFFYKIINVYIYFFYFSDRRRRSPSPPLDEEERDKRTVFVMQLAARLRSRELADFFATVGKVRDAKIIADRISRRSKGYIL